jgi:hypothetical protein
MLMGKVLKIKKLGRLRSSHGNNTEVLDTIHVVNNFEIWSGFNPFHREN